MARHVGAGGAPGFPFVFVRRAAPASHAGFAAPLSARLAARPPRAADHAIDRRQAELLESATQDRARALGLAFKSCSDAAGRAVRAAGSCVRAAGSGMRAAPGASALVALGLCVNAGALLSLGAPAGSISVLAAIFVASAASSIAGFAFSAICGAMLFHLIDAPVRVVQIMLLCSIASQIFQTASIRDSISWRALAPFLVGGLIGLPIGIGVLTTVSRAAYAGAFGALLVAYAVFKLVHPTFTLRARHPGLEVLVGVLGGITGGAAAFPGAFVTIWCGFQGWDKNRQRALYQPFIVVMQIIAVVAIAGLHAARGTAGAERTSAFNAIDLLYVPAALLGTWCGLACFAGLSDRQFALAVNVLLLGSGCAFML